MERPVGLSEGSWQAHGPVVSLQRAKFEKPDSLADVFKFKDSTFSSGFYPCIKIHSQNNLCSRALLELINPWDKVSIKLATWLEIPKALFPRKGPYRVKPLHLEQWITGSSPGSPEPC